MLSAQDAVRRAAVLRLRPIMMTTMAAMLGGAPLMLGTGTGLGTRDNRSATLLWEASS